MHFPLQYNRSPLPTMWLPRSTDDVRTPYKNALVCWSHHLPSRLSLLSCRPSVSPSLPRLRTCIVYRLWQEGEYLTSKANKEISACLINCQKERRSKQAFVFLLDTMSNRVIIPLSRRLLFLSIKQAATFSEDE